MYILFWKVKCVVWIPCLDEKRPPSAQRWVTGISASRIKIFILLVTTIAAAAATASMTSARIWFLLLWVSMAIHTGRNTITPVITHSLLHHAVPDAHWIPHMVSLRVFYILISSLWPPPLTPNWGLPMEIGTVFLLLLWLQASLSSNLALLQDYGPLFCSSFMSTEDITFPKRLVDSSLESLAMQSKTMLTLKVINYLFFFFLQHRDLNWHH